MDVRLPDGRILRNVPEGTTKAQIAAKLGMDENQEQVQADEGIFDRYGREAADAAKNPNIVSSMAKGISAVSNLGMGMAGKLVPDQVKEVVGSVAESLMGAAQHLPGMKSYQKTWEKQPQWAKDVEQAAFDVTGLTGTGLAIKWASNLARKGLNAASDASTSIFQKKIPQPTLAEKAAKARADASELYKSQENIQFSPEQTAQIQKNLMANIPKDDLSYRGFASSQAGKQTKEILDSLSTELPTMQGLLDRRAMINDAWATNKFKGEAKEAARLDVIKRAIDDVLINPKTGKWQEANRDFGIAATKQDLSALVEKAGAMSQPANSLDRAITNYLLSREGKMMRPEERLILEQMIKDSYTKELKRSISSRLTRGVGAIIGAKTGLFGGVAGDVLGTIVSKAARDNLFANKVAVIEELFDMLDTRPMPKIPEAVKPTQKLLPSPNTPRPMTSDQIKAAQEKINKNPKKPSGDIERNPNMDGIPNTTVRNPDGTLERAPKMSMPYRNTQAYKNLPYIKQRFVDKTVQDYTSGKSKAEVIRYMSRRGQISPQDANEILESLKDIKVWRFNRNKSD